MEWRIIINTLAYHYRSNRPTQSEHLEWHTACCSFYLRDFPPILLFILFLLFSVLKVNKIINFLSPLMSHEEKNDRELYCRWMLFWGKRSNCCIASRRISLRISWAGNYHRCLEYIVDCSAWNHDQNSTWCNSAWTPYFQMIPHIVPTDKAHYD